MDIDDPFWKWGSPITISPHSKDRLSISVIKICQSRRGVVSQAQDKIDSEADQLIEPIFFIV
jgi:hypothetical protein